MTLDLNQVSQNILSWVEANIPNNVPAIFLYQNGPRPVSNYVTINLLNFTQIGEDFTFPPTSDAGTVQISGDRELTVQIAAYGGINVDPVTLLENLRSSLQIESVLDTLIVNGIAYGNNFPINDTSVLIDTLYERRAQMDVLFRIGQTNTDTPGVINTVNMEGEYKNPAGDVIETVEITVPPT